MRRGNCQAKKFAGSRFVIVRRRCKRRGPIGKRSVDLVKVQDAHDRRKCRDFNGSAPWACGDCDCTTRLEKKLSKLGEAFVEKLTKPSGEL